MMNSPPDIRHARHARQAKKPLSQSKLFALDADWLQNRVGWGGPHIRSAISRFGFFFFLSEGVCVCLFRVFSGAGRKSKLGFELSGVLRRGVMYVLDELGAGVYDLLRAGRNVGTLVPTQQGAMGNLRGVRGLGFFCLLSYLSFF